MLDAHEGKELISMQELQILSLQFTATVHLNTASGRVLCLKWVSYLDARSKLLCSQSSIIYNAVQEHL